MRIWIYVAMLLVVVLAMSLFCFPRHWYLQEGYSPENPMEIHLVVSRYNESLQWLRDEPFCNYRVTVYNKGVNDDFYHSKRMTVHRLPNVGKCDHTYLYHICSAYDTLADFTMFLPGSVDVPHKYEHAKRWVRAAQIYQQPVYVGYKHDAGIAAMFASFEIEHYQSGNHDNAILNKHEELTKNDLRPFGVWYAHHFGTQHVPYYNFYGIFGVHRKHIHQHSVEHYKPFLKELEQSAFPEVGHYYERAWAAVFWPMEDVMYIQEGQVEDKTT